MAIFSKARLLQAQQLQSIESQKEHTILIVDDEATNRQMLREMLSSEYNILEAGDGVEALDLVRQHCSNQGIQVIVSDQRMPRMQGTEFFEHTLSLMPNAIRIILTAFTDIDGLIDSINKGRIYKFLVKPVVRQDFLLMIRQAVEEYEQTRENVQLLKELKIKVNVFERLVPEPFLKRLAPEGFETFEFGTGKSDFMTILWASIRELHGLTQSMKPQELYKFINRYLDLMSQPLHEHHGFINKFMDNAFMALFHHPQNTEAQEAYDAINAALALQQTVNEYNRHRPNPNDPSISMGIGIHSGTVAIGTAGSSDRMDSTVVGENVAMSVRLEGLTKYYDASILVSQDTIRLIQSHVPFKMRVLDWVKVSGITRPMKLYEVYECDPVEIQSLKDKTKSLIVEGLEKRRKKNWEGATACFQAAQKKNPNDVAIQRLIQQCQDLSNTRLPDDWDGAVTVCYQ